LPLEEISENETILELQQELAELQTQFATFQSDTTLLDQISQLQSDLLQLQSGQTQLEDSLLTFIPLGSLIATNGTLSQEEMNTLGRALCDGSEISSQVPDALLKGTTLNLAGRMLIGAGNYAKDDTITFTLGHVDEYVRGTIPQKGEISHLLTLAEMPYHTHGISLKTTQGGANETIAIPNDQFSTLNSALNFSTQPAGGDQPHNNMPPFHVVHYYLKVK
jgi:microcystin-dependent protein